MKREMRRINFEIESDLKILEEIFLLEQFKNNLTPAQRTELEKGLNELLKLLNEDGDK